MREPTLEEIDRLRRLEKACQFVLHHCAIVQHDWTRLARLQEKLPEMASTMNKSMLAVMCIPSEDEDGEPRYIWQDRDEERAQDLAKEIFPDGESLSSSTGT